MRIMDFKRSAMFLAIDGPCGNVPNLSASKCCRRPLAYPGLVWPKCLWRALVRSSSGM